MSMVVEAPDSQQTNSFEHLVALAEAGQDEELKQALASLHPADAAEAINVVERFETAGRLFLALPADVAPSVLSLVSPRIRERIAQDLSIDRLRQIVAELDSDDAADLLGTVSKQRAQSILEGLPGPLSARIQQLLRYPADTAGGLMQSEYAAVLEGATVEEAIEIVRSLAEAIPDIQSVFVVDHRFHLLGVLPLARLILAREGQAVDTVMDPQVIAVTVDADQEEVARLFRKYDLLALPVTDPRGALLGRITVDDVVDVLEEEANEDFAKLSGLGQEEPVFDAPLRTIRRRLPWLGLNLVTTSVSASVIGLFQGTIESTAIAAALMTIVAAQGGNAGVQTLTVMVRGLAMGQVSLAHARPILLKELTVAGGNGTALGIMAGTGAYLLHGQRLLAVVLGLALLVNYLVAALVASIIPLALRWLGADPAVASSVFVTACTDICGFFSFLGLLSIGLRAFG
jgi:magnesium transporter